jgi:hypothetical protein
LPNAEKPVREDPVEEVKSRGKYPDGHFDVDQEGADAEGQWNQAGERKKQPGSVTGRTCFYHDIPHAVENKSRMIRPGFLFVNCANWEQSSSAYEKPPFRGGDVILSFCETTVE